MKNKKIIYSLIIGAIAGIIDIIPMIIQGLDIYSDISAFIFWIIMGFIIAHISLPIKDWLRGMMIAIILAIPIMILVSANELITIVGHYTGEYAR